MDDPPPRKVNFQAANPNSTYATELRGSRWHDKTAGRCGAALEELRSDWALARPVDAAGGRFRR